MSKGKIIFRTPSKIKIRQMWQRNPVEKVKPSVKIYHRPKRKQEDVKIQTTDISH